MSIAFIGLGSMGSAIAANLLGAGHEVTVWNRSAGKAGALIAAGAVEAKTPREAASDAGIAFTMVADDPALLSILRGEDGLLKGLPQNCLHVSMSTIGVATSDAVADLHAKHGQRYLAAPVLGRPDAAAAAKLFILAAGADADIDEAQPLFEAIGQRVFRVGVKPSMANLVKLCGNFGIMAAVEMMAETFALAEKGGVPKAMMLEVFTNTIFDAPIYRNYGRMIVEKNYKPAAFKAPLGLKDMRLAAEAANTYRVPMPLLSLVRDHLLETIAKEGDDIDWAGIGLTIGKNAGL